MNYSRMLDRLELKRSHAVELKRQFKSSLLRAKGIVKDAETVQGIIQSMCLSIQKDMHEKVANVVTKCLQAVFDRPYEFRIEFEKKRGNTEARFVFHRDGNDYDPLTECGGGVLDVAVVGLRLAKLLMSHPKPRNVLFMDEPFRHLDKNAPERVTRLITELSKEFGIQIVQITHNPLLEAGKGIRL